MKNGTTQKRNHHDTPPRRQKTRQNNVRKRHRNGKEKHTEKAHTEARRKCSKCPFSRVRVCVFFLAKQPPPLLKSTLIFPIFTIAPPFPFPARACVVRVVVVQWWYVAMCFCVGVLCIFPPCARWYTVQKCLCHRLACACVCCGARCRNLRVCRCLSFTKLCRKTECSRASLSVCLSLCAYVLM